GRLGHDLRRGFRAIDEPADDLGHHEADDRRDREGDVAVGGHRNAGERRELDDRPHGGGRRVRDEADGVGLEQAPDEVHHGSVPAGVSASGSVSPASPSSPSTSAASVSSATSPAMTDGND